MFLFFRNDQFIWTRTSFKFQKKDQLFDFLLTKGKDGNFQHIIQHQLLALQYQQKIKAYGIQNNSFPIFIIDEKFHYFYRMFRYYVSTTNKSEVIIFLKLLSSPIQLKTQNI